MSDELRQIRQRMALLEARLARQTLWNVLLVALLLLAPFYHALLRPYTEGWLARFTITAPTRLKYMAGPHYEYFFLLVGVVLVAVALAAIFIFQDGRAHRPRR